MISAASDFAVGIDLKNSGKLNWSTTASYYSIFHSARLIIFLALGNYPQDHNISQLFARNSANTRDPLKLNALKFNSHQVALTTTISDYYKDLLNLPNSEFLFNSMNEILSNAKKLRNNSNYDALLMAHEWHHINVTNDFVKLSDSMSNGAKLCLKIASNCFENYIIYDAEIRQNREKIKYLVKNYIVRRLYPSISERIQDKNVLNTVILCTQRLENISNEFEINTDIENQLNEFEKSFLISNFSQKKNLMDNFNTDVQTLAVKVKLALADLEKYI
ncbi:HEPN domain-containing protein [Anabaena sp. CCY 9910]|uniref:HEPN domain-containing protein n=1 Tax=Anabaena sp. CCY 9910 TaxID=3103870 RepID=UPI0039E19ADF